MPNALWPTTDLEEFFFEIIPQVQVEKNEDNKQLLVLDDRGEIIYTPPLILLDYVPVREIIESLSAITKSSLFADSLDKVLSRQDRLKAKIRETIDENGGKIPFNEYMVKL